MKKPVIDYGKVKVHVFICTSTCQAMYPFLHTISILDTRRYSGEVFNGLFGHILISIVTAD